MDDIYADMNFRWPDLTSEDLSKQLEALILQAHAIAVGVSAGYGQYTVSHVQAWNAMLGHLIRESEAGRGQWSTAQRLVLRQLML